MGDWFSRDAGNQKYLWLGGGLGHGEAWMEWSNCCTLKMYCRKTSPSSFATFIDEKPSVQYKHLSLSLHTAHLSVFFLLKWQALFLKGKYNNFSLSSQEVSVQVSNTFNHFNNKIWTNKDTYLSDMFNWTHWYKISKKIMKELEYVSGRYTLPN